MKKIILILTTAILVSCGKESIADDCRMLLPTGQMTQMFNGKDRDANGIRWVNVHVEALIYCDNDPYNHCEGELAKLYDTPKTMFIYGPIIGPPIDTVTFEERYGLRCD